MKIGKKFSLLFVLVLSLSVPLVVMAEYIAENEGHAIMEWTVNSPVYTLNGEFYIASAVPFVEYNSTSGLPMMPIRYVAEGLGATVAWNRAAGTVIVDTYDATWLISIDSPLPNDMGTPFVHSGRVFVPLAYVSEVLGASVNWNSETGAILIY